ncbi:MAG: hypothetical protein KAU52_01610 [Methanosarcinales archaeon]|nr:hypothetical protein [Methanosarcinales archaeon]
MRRLGGDVAIAVDVPRARIPAAAGCEMEREATPGGSATQRRPVGGGL